MKAIAASLRKLEPRWKFFLLLYAGLAWGHCLDLHWYLCRTKDSDRWHAWHDAIIHGNQFYPDQYRPLTYWIAELIYQLRMNLPWVTPKQAEIQFELAHLTVRFIFILLALFLVHLYLRKWFSSSACTAATIFIAAVLPLTVYRCSILVTDPLNLVVFITGFWLIRENKAIWLIPLVFIGMLNRETAGMLLFVYVFVNWGRPWRSWVPMAGAILASAVAVFIGFRLYYGPRDNWATWTLQDYLRINFLEWESWQMIILFLGAWVLYSFTSLKSKPVFLRRCLYMLPIFFICHSVSGFIREVRYWLPVLPILLPLAMWSIWGPEKRNYKEQCRPEKADD